MTRLDEAEIQKRTQLRRPAFGGGRTNPVDILSSRMYPTSPINYGQIKLQTRKKGDWSNHRDGIPARRTGQSG
jgi:hypothetical protein